MFGWLTQSLHDYYAYGDQRPLPPSWLILTCAIGCSVAYTVYLLYLGHEQLRASLKPQIDVKGLANWWRIIRARLFVIAVVMFGVLGGGAFGGFLSFALWRQLPGLLVFIVAGGFVCWAVRRFKKHRASVR